MHFSEMDHLPYRHAWFVPSSSLVVLQISSCSFFLMENLYLLHASVMLFLITFLFLFVGTFFLVGGFFRPSLDFLLSLFGEGFFPLGFLLCSGYRDCIVLGYLIWPRCWDPFLSTFFLYFVGLRHFPKLHLRGGC